MRQYLQELFIKSANAADGLVESGLKNSAKTARLSTKASLPQIIGNILNYLLGFVGVILLIMLIYGGILWMTAGGNEENTKKAKGYIVNSIIGLIVVLASYAILRYVYDALDIYILNSL